MLRRFYYWLRGWPICPFCHEPVTPWQKIEIQPDTYRVAHTGAWMKGIPLLDGRGNHLCDIREWF